MRIAFDRNESLEDRAHERELQERRLDHERAEQWRDRRVRAADDFSTGVQQAMLRLHEAYQAASVAANEGAFSLKGVSVGSLAEAQRVNGEAIARVGRIKLVFGENSEPADLAEKLVRLLEVVLTRLKGMEVPEAQRAIEKAYQLQTKFNRAALDVINQ